MNESVSLFREETPEVAKAFDGLIQSFSSLDGLDDKTRQLIYLGIRASQADVGSVVAHTPMAKAAGASWEEIRGAILLTLAVCGVRGVFTCLGPAQSAFQGS